jgi:hypothetical protein
MMWPTDVMKVGHVNDEGVPLDMDVNTTLSKVCGLAARQRLSQKGEKVTMKIISHTWRSNKRKLVKIWREKGTPSVSIKI